MNARFESPLRIEVIGERSWMLIDDLVFYSKEYQGRFVAPAGFQTDLASIPRLVWSIFPKVGLHDKAAVIHDAAYANALTTFHPDRESRRRVFTVKHVADSLFLEGMEAEDSQPRQPVVHASSRGHVRIAGRSPAGREPDHRSRAASGGGAVIARLLAWLLSLLRLGHDNRPSPPKEHPMFDNLPIGPPVILPSSVPVDEIGRPEITQAQKQKIRDALNLVDPDAKAALLVFADLPSKTARANFAWRVGKGWTVAAGGGFEWEGEEAGGLDRRREGVEMSDEELPTCPHCDCRLRPERLGAGRYVCPGCARVFSAPPSKA